MMIKTKQTWKDLIEGSNHIGLTRRDFMARGLATGVLSVALPKLVFGDFVKAAYAQTASNCPAPVRAMGALAQIFANGGPTMGARFISEAQAASMNATMAANYGISGQANLMKLGPNMVIDKTSPFGATLLQGPTGYAGGAAGWQTNVLSKISGGGHLGPFNSDDGGGVNLGNLGVFSPFKQSQMGKDLTIGASVPLTTWANGLPSATISGNNLAPASLATSFSLIPAAAGLTSASNMTATSNASLALSQSMNSILQTSTRKGGSSMVTAASCGFLGNAVMADPTYGTTLFTPSGITALSSKLTVGSLSNEEQAQLAAYYQSAMGVAGGVVMQFNGRDYHGQSPQTVIAPADIEEARAVVMFLAACDAAQAPGALVYVANGQAIASGVQSVTASIGGTNTTVNAPVAKGDAGGSYNAGLIIFYDPKGAPPAAVFTGTVTAASGNAKASAGVPSVPEAMAGLYLSAMKWTMGATPTAALTTMQAAGVAKTPTATMVI